MAGNPYLSPEDQSLLQNVLARDYAMAPTSPADQALYSQAINQWNSKLEQPNSQQAQAQALYAQLQPQAAPERLTAESFKDLPPEAAYADYVNSVRDQGQAAKAQADAQAGAAQDTASLMRGQNAQRAANATLDSFHMQERQRAVDDAAKQLQEADKHVNAFEMDYSFETKNSVASALALALSGVGDALARFGGDRSTSYAHTTMQIINSKIQNDLNRQREQLDGLRKTRDSKANLFNVARTMFSDQQQQNQFAQASMELIYSNELKAQSAQSSNQVLRAGGDLAAAQFETHARETIAKLATDMAEQRLRNEWIKTRKNESSPNEMSNADRIAAARLKRDQEADARKPEVIAQNKGARLSADLVVADPKVAQVFAPKVEELQQSVSTARKLFNSINRILELRSQRTLLGDKLNPYSDRDEEIKSEAANLILDDKEFKNLGVLNGGDRVILEELQGKATSFTNEADVKLRALRGTVARGIRDELMSKGFTPVNLDGTTYTAKTPVQDIPADAKFYDLGGGNIQWVRPANIPALLKKYPNATETQRP